MIKLKSALSTIILLYSCICIITCTKIISLGFHSPAKITHFCDHSLVNLGTFGSNNIFGS